MRLSFDDTDTFKEAAVFVLIIPQVIQILVCRPSLTPKARRSVKILKRYDILAKYCTISVNIMIPITSIDQLEFNMSSWWGRGSDDSNDIQHRLNSLLPRIWVVANSGRWKAGFSKKKPNKCLTFYQTNIIYRNSDLFLHSLIMNYALFCASTGFNLSNISCTRLISATHPLQRFQSQYIQNIVEHRANSGIFFHDTITVKRPRSWRVWIRLAFHSYVVVK